MAGKFRLVVFLGVVLASVSALAQDDGVVDRPWGVSVGVFLPSHGTLCGVDTETGYTLAISHSFLANEQDCWLLQLRYSRYDLAGDRWVHLISPTLEYRWIRTAPFYVAMAVGPVFGHNSAGCNSSSFSYELAAGWNASSTVALEARWISGARRGERGLAFSAGIRF